MYIRLLSSVKKNSGWSASWICRVTNRVHMA